MRPFLLIMAVILAFNLLYAMLSRQAPQQSATISYSRFRQELDADNVRKIVIRGSRIDGEFRAKTRVSAMREGKETALEVAAFSTVMPNIQDPSLMPELSMKKVEVTAVPTETSPLVGLLISLLPWLLIFAVWWFVMRRLKSQAPGSMFERFSSSGAKTYNAAERVKVTFADVAGLENPKRELSEIVEYLRNPGKFQRAGGKIPKGILLAGPPGTGKTLLARAVAGEAGVNFFSISASQFIEVFVGVGASRVRDLFSSAKKSAPSIMFIDELDAVGRSRGAGFGGGHDEREQTLNQLLSEMDGFDPHDEVVVLAATNRPDVLDPALLRPGRFDRHVVIERPDWRDREQILKVHARKISLDTNVDLALLARGTPGMTGADLENLLNEAAILAAREDAASVTMEHLEQAKDKILMGAERRMFITEEEKRVTAYHEAGHTLVARLLPGTDPVHKVSILPRGMALGVTQQLPEDDRYRYPRSYLLNRLSVCLGGRVAERLVFDDISTGAENDLKMATELAEKMVCQWGMSEKIGPIAFSRGQEHPFLGMKLAQEKTFSERMAWLIDQEIKAMIGEAEERSREIISSNREKLDVLAEALLLEETLDGRRIDAVLAEG